jgi:putative flippase GtrA
VSPFVPSGLADIQVCTEPSIGVAEAGAFAERSHTPFGTAGRRGDAFPAAHPDATTNPKAVHQLRAIAARPSTLLRRSRLIRWSKFNFVGGIGILVQFAALFALKSLLDLEYLLATALAVEIAVLHNFVWHEQFTWADRTAAGRKAAGGKCGKRIAHSWRGTLERLARFQMANGAVSIASNLVLMKVMVGEERRNYLLANVIAIGLGSIVNFLVSEQWVFG